MIQTVCDPCEGAARELLDGHTVRPAITKLKKLTGVETRRIYIDKVSRAQSPLVSGSFCKVRCGGWSWYAGDEAITGSFGEDAHHDQEAG